ncbi:MAG: GNAT family N-acetyltransferase [Pseudomonadota bacterium]
MPGRIRYRPLRPDDGEAIADLHRRAILAVPRRFYTDAERQSWCDGIDPSAYQRLAAAGEIFDIATDGADRPIGFSGHLLQSDGWGEVSGLYVDPAHQGRGLGGGLLDRAERSMRACGRHRIRVSASLAALDFYRAHGYGVTGEAQHHTRGGTAIAIRRMEKRLTPTAPEREDSAPWRNFYGRRHGKRLRAGQRDLLDTRLAALAPQGVGWAENPQRDPIDLGALFPGLGRVWLEIGFGGGEHMIAQARANPDIGILGCEPFVNGVAQLLSAVERAGVDNLRIHAGDARDLMDVLPPASIDRAFLLYPDPWPKRRHWKRRFMNPEPLDQLARVMRAGADLRLATDIGDYVRHSLLALDAHPGFVWTADRAADWRVPWHDWSGTRYEAKAIREGRMPYYITAMRIGH